MSAARVLDDGDGILAGGRGRLGRGGLSQSQRHEHDHHEDDDEYGNGRTGFLLPGHGESVNF
jgi:hypothetical protein